MRKTSKQMQKTEANPLLVGTGGGRARGILYRNSRPKVGASVDPVMFYVTFILLAIGLTMVYSASAVYASSQNGDAHMQMQ